MTNFLLRYVYHNEKNTQVEACEKLENRKMNV